VLLQMTESKVLSVNCHLISLGMIGIFVTFYYYCERAEASAFVDDSWLVKTCPPVSALPVGGRGGRSASRLDSLPADLRRLCFQSHSAVKRHTWTWQATS